MVILRWLRLRCKSTTDAAMYLPGVQPYPPSAKLGAEHVRPTGRDMQSGALLTITSPLFSTHISLQRVC